MYSTLFLGDSYTIGEGVPLSSSYPYQTTQLLRRGGYPFYAPEIIARTGWTTDELLTAIGATTLLPSYSFVSLLIGVNNQYRGRDTRDFASEFSQLLRLALQLAGAPHRVFVLSIPDWGVSPFAAGHDRESIARGIDDYNTVARAITEQAVTEQESPVFIDITTHSRTAGADPGAFTTDGLHPARTTLAHWARELSSRISKYCSNHPY